MYFTSNDIPWQDYRQNEFLKKKTIPKWSAEELDARHPGSTICSRTRVFGEILRLDISPKISGPFLHLSFNFFPDSSSCVRCPNPSTNIGALFVATSRATSIPFVDFIAREQSLQTIEFQYFRPHVRGRVHFYSKILSMLQPPSKKDQVGFPSCNSKRDMKHKLTNK